MLPAQALPPAPIRSSLFVNVMSITCRQPIAKIFIALAIIAALGGAGCMVAGTLLPSLQSWTFTLSYTCFGATGLFFVALTPIIGYAYYKNHSYLYSGGDNRIKIHVVKADLKFRPEFHLRKFAQQIQNHVRIRDEASMHVTFIGMLGSDMGGLTKDYIDDLLEGLTSQQSLFTKMEETSLAVPKAMPGRSLTVFEHLGQVMMYCYPTLPIGFYIDPSVFHVAFNLRPDEIDNSYERLEFNRKFELYQILIDSQHDVPHQNRMNLSSQPEWNEEQLTSVIETLVHADCMPEEFKITPQELMGVNISANQIWQTNRVRGIKQTFFQNRERVGQIRNALTAWRQQNNPPARVEELLRIPAWDREQLQEAASLIFGGRHRGLNLRELMGGSLPTNNEMWETVEVKTINPIFRLQYEQRVREALARLKMLDTREEVVESIQDLSDVEAWNDEKFKEAVEIIFDQDNIKFEQIKNSVPNKDQLRALLKGWLEECFDPQIRGIHSIAKGMKSICVKGRAATPDELNERWNHHFLFGQRVTIAEFNTKLQGSIEPRYIIEKIDERYSERIEEKVTWLKEWIGEDATSLQIRKFLKFVTGSSTLPGDRTIRVSAIDDEQNRSPFPRTHTCSNKIDILVGESADIGGFHNHDKEHFIACIELAISGEGGGYAFS